MRAAAIALAILPLAPLTVTPAAAAERSLAITVDDLPAQRAEALSAERVVEINRRLVATLAAEKVPAVGFVCERKLEVDGATTPERLLPLELWLDAGLELGNHTYSHPDLHRIPTERFQQEILAGERVTRRLAAARGVPLRYFRHPYLHTGRDLATRAAVERFLADHGYTVAPVTVDNSEWIFARAYDTARERGDGELGGRIAAAYLEHMEAMVEFYEKQSRALLDREIPQVLLIHANDLNADHLGDLLGLLRRRGYRFTDLADALTDPAYALPDRYTGPAGISWIQRWAMARGVDPSFFQGEPTVPAWVNEAAGLSAAARTDPCPGCSTTLEEMPRVEGRRTVRGGSPGAAVVKVRKR